MLRPRMTPSPVAAQWGEGEGGGGGAPRPPPQRHCCPTLARSQAGCPLPASAKEKKGVLAGWGQYEGGGEKAKGGPPANGTHLGRGGGAGVYGRHCCCSKGIEGGHRGAFLHGSGGRRCSGSGPSAAPPPRCPSQRAQSQDHAHADACHCRDAEPGCSGSRCATSWTKRGAGGQARAPKAIGIRGVAAVALHKKTAGWRRAGHTAAGHSAISSVQHVKGSRGHKACAAQASRAAGARGKKEAQKVGIGVGQRHAQHAAGQVAGGLRAGPRWEVGYRCRHNAA